VGFHFDAPEQILTSENKVVLDAIARLGVLAIERIGGTNAFVRLSEIM
jgi:hypothetical protein